MDEVLIQMTSMLLKPLVSGQRKLQKIIFRRNTRKIICRKNTDDESLEKYGNALKSSGNAFKDEVMEDFAKGNMTQKHLIMFENHEEVLHQWERIMPRNKGTAQKDVTESFQKYVQELQRNSSVSSSVDERKLCDLQCIILGDVYKYPFEEWGKRLFYVRYNDKSYHFVKGAKKDESVESVKSVSKPSRGKAMETDGAAEMGRKSNVIVTTKPESKEVESDRIITTRTRSSPTAEVSHESTSLTSLDDGTENLPSASEGSFSVQEPLYFPQKTTEITEENEQIKTRLSTMTTSPLDDFKDAESSSFPNFASGADDKVQPVQSAEILPEGISTSDEEDNQIGQSPRSTISPIVVSKSSPDNVLVTSPARPSLKADYSTSKLLSSDKKTDTEVQFAFKEFLSLTKAALGNIVATTNPLTRSTSNIDSFKDAWGSGRLKPQETLGFFLYCILYTQDKKISSSKLVEYWIQDGLITGNAVDARKKGDEIVTLFNNAALLDIDNDGLSIKIPDAIRKSALGILLPEVEVLEIFEGADSWTNLEEMRNGSSSRSLDQYLLKPRAGLKKAPSEDEWRKAKMIFLMDNELSSLPKVPKCTDLRVLFAQRNHRIRVIPDSFFQYMHSVVILNLSETSIVSLPSSISKLDNLKKFVLRGCECLNSLPHDVGGLKLKFFDLHGTNMYELPEAIGEVESLEHLEVSFYGPIDHKEYSMLPSKLISQGIISRLKLLSHLSLDVFPGDRRWSENIKSDVMDDLCKKKSLTDLGFHFPAVKHLEHFIQNSLSWKEGLRKFNFVIGHDVKRILTRVPHHLELEYNQQDRCLRFVNDSHETIPEAIAKVLTCATAFYLDHHLKVKSLSEFGARNINGLKFCIVVDCPEIETITDGKEEAFPNLEDLSIHHMGSLTSIWRYNHVPRNSYTRLKRLRVETSPNLSFLLTSSMARCVPQLEELVVEDCISMEKLIALDDKRTGDHHVPLLPKLKMMVLRYLPRLVSIWGGCSWPSSLEHLTFMSCPNLKKLRIESNNKIVSSIKSIKAQQEWWDCLEWEDFVLSKQLEARFIPFPERKFVH